MSLSGAKFARLVGIRYSTFANWALQRRRRRVSAGRPVNGMAGGGEAAAKAAPLRLLEAVLEAQGQEAGSYTGCGGLVIELRGGSRMLVGCPVQLEMAAELLALIAQRARARC